MAGEAPRDDLRLPKLPRFGEGEAESVTFCEEYGNDDEAYLVHSNLVIRDSRVR